MAADTRKELVERVAASSYIRKSGRLRELLLYLCKRVLDDSVQEIHEQEVGHRVFGRPPDYDTNSDNIVRVHASQLRKRLEQYFSLEGREEPFVIEIPKGNYAPVFHPRRVSEVPARQDEIPAGRPADWRIWTLALIALLFACSAVILFVQLNAVKKRTAAAGPDKPAVKLFWAQIFRPEQNTDIVLDDAAVGLYQDLAGRPIALSEYFDRSYLRKLEDAANDGGLPARQAGAMILRRQSSYASAHLLWQLFQAAGPLHSRSAVHFARDYSFRGLRSNDVILLGQTQSNPWIEPFEAHLGLRWNRNAALGTQYPVDTWENPPKPERFRVADEPGESREGYCAIALVPNLAGNGTVLIISATGGSAASAGVDFLSDEQGISRLRGALPADKNGRFPYFEALLKMKSRSAVPRDVSVEICRSPR